MKENAHFQFDGTAQGIATLMHLIAKSKPEALIPCLYVKPSYYDLGLKAAKDKEPGFEIRKRKLYFQGMRVIKFKPHPF